MLAPPGSAKSNRTGGARRTASKVSESPDDVIRQLQRLHPNKKCADCSSKLPSCVNLTVGSFVCLACGGIHRELNQRVKGVGHSSFTAEEAAFMQSTDNEKVNLIWLAKYNPRIEPMKPPEDNTNQHLLKAWIRRKYYDKQWYAEPGSDVQSTGPSSPQEQPQPQQPKQNLPSKPSVAQPQPTMAQIPPMMAPAQPPAAAMDLFGGPPVGQQRTQPTPQPTQHQADPFGDHSFPADFGSSQARTAFPVETAQNQQPAVSPPPPEEKFANFDGPGFANFPDEPYPRQSGNGNFAQFNSPTRQMSPQQSHAPSSQPKPIQPRQQPPPPPLPAMDHVETPHVPSLAQTKLAFKEGQTVYYKTDGPAEIIKIHQDQDDLEPFYTVRLFNGKEKRTTDAYLHVENPIPALLQNLIKKLNDTQLQSVYEFALATLQNKPTVGLTVAEPSSLATVSTVAKPVAESTVAKTVAKAEHKPATTETVAAPEPALKHEDDDDPFAGLGHAGSSGGVLSGGHSYGGTVSNPQGMVTMPPAINSGQNVTNVNQPHGKTGQEPAVPPHQMLPQGMNNQQRMMMQPGQEQSMMTQQHVGQQRMAQQPQMFAGQQMPQNQMQTMMSGQLPYNMMPSQMPQMQGFQDHMGHGHGMPQNQPHTMMGPGHGVPSGSMPMPAQGMPPTQNQPRMMQSPMGQFEGGYMGGGVGMMTNGGFGGIPTSTNTAGSSSNPLQPGMPQNKNVGMMSHPGNVGMPPQYFQQFTTPQPGMMYQQQQGMPNQRQKQQPSTDPFASL